MRKSVKYQEKVFDKKAGKNKIYTLGRRDNRNHAIKIQKIIEALQLKDHDKVLEIGIGEGEHAHKCLQSVDIKFVGIDISEKTLEVADKRLKPKFQGRFELRKENAKNLSFNDNTFDVVFSASTLHHMKEPYKMISEMARVLKPNGRIALVEPNWIYPTNICLAVLLKEDRNMWLMRKNNFLKWLKSSGLQEISIENFLYTPPKPEFLIPVYNHIDRICNKIPFIRGCSLMLFGSAIK